MNSYARNALVAGAIAVIAAFMACTEKPARVSSHLSYAGYGEPRYRGFTKKTLYVAMRDGTELAVDAFVPAGGPPAKFPAIFVFTPYGRSYCFPEMKWYEKLYARVTRGTFGPVFDWSTRDDVKLFLSHGFAFVVADMRGAGASFGSQIPFTPGIVDDGVELVDWIASRPWSNGKVGMMGRSYLGWIQLMLAARKPKALACIMPEVILCDAYTEGLRPGGIDAVAWIERYSRLLYDLNLNRYSPDELSVPAAPVVDEDGDGDLADEMPVMTKGERASFVARGGRVYADGKKRKGIYFQATMDHRRNVLFNSFLRRYAPYIDSRDRKVFGNYGYMDGSPGWYLKEIIESGIPVYHIGGWYDGFVKGTTKSYATMQGKTAARLHVAPRFHYPPYMDKSYKKYFSYDVDYEKIITVERLRFFDRYLKGVRNGIDREPPVNIYVMNRGWRAENEWPLRREKPLTLYMGGEGRLAAGNGAGGSDEYRVDFAHSSSYGKNRANRWLLMYVPEGLMDRTELDKRCLRYETPPLQEDTEITGHPVADLWVSSNRDDGDFYVYLADVDESGRSLYVTEGQLRAGWRKLYDDNDQVNGKIDIRPDLPWHGYRKGQYEARPLAGGKAVELRFDLMPTSWVFKKGHRLRIAIACADNRNFEMNPGLCSGNDPGSCPETVVRLHRGKDRPSRIVLPLIPAAR